ncbi:lactoylglutathione lyase family protein [Aequorivita sublithincola DSM 14238]|uniref:Lactoylglutathione lyase family protein n=1 Tax=Aequorivita sublithincola (strain DSM 14238 / LMG 21431 / ACAM 643 / 9-3) TaxID=746697 RepID=I3YZB3_AEQSU|nr:VOC family protein [Aequorivita sublithincola]AFL82331.1 lactoylglutathione lyase family protein [Aequorivita sublithincola DSM 14238]
MGTMSTKPKPANSKMKDFITWFEIPVLNMERATSFYNHIYGIKMKTNEVKDYAMAIFPVTTGIGGALVMGQGCIPSETGSLVYLNGGRNLQPILDKVEEAGGRIIMPKTKISDDAGYFALFTDSEGNKLAINSKK